MSLMSAFGPKQTWACALHMSAFGGKADMTLQRGMSAFEKSTSNKESAMGIDDIERSRLSERDKLPLNDFEVMAEIYAEPSQDETYRSRYGFIEV
jgi:hypothetical protein